MSNNFKFQPIDEKQYKHIIELQNKFICRFLPDWKTTFVNDAFCTYYMINKKEIEGFQFTMLLPKDDREKMKMAISTLNKDNPVGKIEYKVILPNGEKRWQQWVGGIVTFDNNVAAKEFQFVGRDITVLKEIEETLNQKKLLLGAIENSTSIAYLVVDHRTDEIISFNRQFCKLWNIEHLEEDMRSGQLKNSDIITACMWLLKDITAYMKSCELLQGENNRIDIEDEIEFTTGKIICRFSNQVRDDEDNYIGRIYIFKDITSRKQSEQELKKHKENLEVIVKERTLELKSTNKKLVQEIAEKEISNRNLEKYRILVENARDMMLFIGETGKILEANDKAVKTYGYTYDELLRLTIYDLREIGQEDIVNVQLRQIHEHGFLFETLHRKKDGTLFNVQVNSQATNINGESVILSIIRDISEKKHMEQQLEYTAKHDSLTNIPNRYYLEEMLQKVNANITTSESAFLIIDLDNFKIVNDTYGHTAGDRVLMGVASCLKRTLRESDFLARIGGDEFAAFIPRTNLEGATLVANKLINALDQDTFYVEGMLDPIRITASIGITMIDKGVEINEVFAYADAALYSAKAEGRNRAVVLQKNEDKIKVFQNNRMLNLLQVALKEDRFSLYFQPIYKSNHEVLYHEVLIRMWDEKDSLIVPSAFLSIAERYGIMQMIDQWVIENTLIVLSKKSDLRVFINLSAVSLGDQTFLEWVESRICKSGVDPARIGFEITESAAIKDLARTERWVHRLRTLGCSFALDDFGVGFSSFSHLHQLPVDYLKIDGSFIRNLDSDSTKVALVQAMNAVAHTLGKQTIAEFVENEAIWDLLNTMGIDCGQGYYLGMPSPISD